MIETGPLGASFSLLLHLQKRQSRLEERDLVVLNERQETPSGVFAGATRRAGPLFLSYCVIPQGHVVSRLCRTTTQRFFCLVGQKKRFQQ